MRGGTKIAVVTDSLKGLGYRIVCTMLHTTREPLTIYMTGPSHSQEKYDITFDIDKDGRIAKALKESGSEIKFAKLDLQHSGSIKAFRDHLQDTYGASHGARPLSILVNSPAPRYSDAERSVERTYFGTKNLTRLLLPIMKRTGDSRVVNVSVAGGQAKYWIPNKELAKKFDLNNLTMKKLDDLMLKYRADAMDGRQVREGWSRPLSSTKPDFTPYIIPKIGLTAHALLLAKEYPGYLINASGGDSWLLGHHAWQGAITPTFLALGSLEGATGGLWIEGKRVDWDTGKSIAK